MDRTRTVEARTSDFLSDGRKEDDGADKSAANLTRPPFCLVIESWLEYGCWMDYRIVEWYSCSDLTSPLPPIAAAMPSTAACAAASVVR